MGYTEEPADPPDPVRSAASVKVITMAEETEEIKTATDARLSRLEEMLAKLSAENAELRSANKELYTFAAQPQTKDESIEDIKAAQIVADTRAKAESEKQQAKTLDEIYKLTLMKLGYPSGQMDGM